MTIGLVLLVLAGVANASFAVPMKLTRRWAWENTWLAFSIAALVVLPPLVAALTVPHLADVYAAVPAKTLALVAACGAGWGVAQVLFGVAVGSIGVALTFSIVLGLSAAMGCLIPFLEEHTDKIGSPGGLALLGGVALVVVGVATCAVAGRRREAATAGGGASEPGKDRAMGRGLVLAAVCGVAASLQNVGFAAGDPLVAKAAELGAAPLWRPNSVWAPLFLAGALPNVGYCVYLLRKNDTTARFGGGTLASHGALAVLMAVLWFSSNVLYGVSAERLGEFGKILGWPVFMSIIVIAASVVGVVTGEWKGTAKEAGNGPLRLQMAGVGLLVVAVFVLSAATRAL